MFHDRPLESAVVFHAKRRDRSALVEAYRLQEVVEYLLNRDELLVKVALQFPDALLNDTVEVVEALQCLLNQDSRYASLMQKKTLLEKQQVSLDSGCACSRSSDGPPPKPVRKTQLGNSLDNPNQPTNYTQLLALCDNTFGSCCPDTITAQHYGAQCIIHFGEACMSTSVSLPVFYVHSRFCFADIPSIWEAVISPLLVREVAVRLATRAQAVATELFTDVNGSPAIQLIVVGAHPSRHIVEEAQRLSSSTPDGISWCWFVDQEGAAADRTDACMKQESESKSWIVNGVRFPMLQTGQDVSCTDNSDAAPPPPVVQIFLFVGPANSAHVLHISGILQFNQMHYNEDQLHLLEALSESVPHLSMMDETWVSANDACQQACKLLKDCPEAPVSSTSVKAAHDYVKQLLEQECGGVSNAVVYRAQLDYQKRIRQRDYNVEVIRGSSAIGILVVSLSIQGYYETTMRLHKLIRLSKKRSYIIYVGHLNEFKLSNFVDTVDCFVAVACPNSRSSYFTQKSDGYMKPVVSPSEILIALSGEESMYRIPAAFNTALEYVRDPLEKALQQAEQPSSDSKGWREESTQLVRSSASVSVGTGGNHALDRLYERSYVGLELRAGETPIQKEIVQGKVGIARGYETERQP